MRELIHHPRRGVRLLCLAAIVAPTAAFAAAGFQDVSDRLDLAGDLTETWGATWGDVNADGYPDLYFTNHRHYSKLLVNQQDGTFVDESRTLDRDGVFTTGWSERDSHAAAWGDLDNDGYQELVHSISSSPSIRLDNDSGVLAFGGELLNERHARQPLLFDSDNDGTLDVHFIARQGYACDETFGEWGLLTQLNGAGLLDLICSDRNHSFPGEIVIHGSGPQAVLPTTNRVFDVISGDFNGDLFNDLIQIIGRDRPDGATLVNSTTVEFQMWVAGDDEQVLTIQTAGSLTFTGVNDRAWRHFDLDDVFIGSGGRHPAASTFTLDPDNPANRGLPTLSSGQGGLKVGYDVQAGAWRVSLAPSRSYDVLHMVATTDQPITGHSLSSLFVGDRPAAPIVFAGSSAGFVNVSAGSGFQAELCASAVAGDFDNDMDLDVYLACRGGAENIANVLYDNLGDGTFVKVPNAGGAGGVIGAAVAQGAGTSDSVVVADYDQDGFLDLAVANGLNMRPQLTGGPKQLFRNLGNGNHWLQFDLRGTASNRDGVGAVLYVTTPDGRVQYREQNGGYHRWSQNYQRVHVGLASHGRADVEVHWPSGNVDSYAGLSADRIFILEEGGVAMPRGPADPDTDGDGIADALDPDDDNDTYEDDVDAFPLDPTEWSDRDGDGVGDNADPFPDDAGNAVCGDPGIDRSVDRGTFLWRDCAAGNGQWLLRTSGGGTGQGLVFTGTVRGNVTAVAPYSIESSDEIDVSAADAVVYLMRVYNTGIDGIDFVAGRGCFTPDLPSDQPIYLGESRQLLPSGSNLDLATGGVCAGDSDGDSDGDGLPDATDPDDDNDGHADDVDEFPLDPTEWVDTDMDGQGDNADPFPGDPENRMCGEPAFQSAEDRGTFVWRDCENDSAVWHLRTTGGGTPSRLDFTGEIYATGGLQNLVGVSLEPNDVLSTPGVDTLGYLLTLYNNGMDGFNFEISGDACIAPAQPSGLPVYFGSERTEMSGAVDLVTGGPC